jgi:hypothetical protein
MYLPKKDSLRDRICRSIAAYGPMDMEAITDHFKYERYNNVKSAVHQLKFYRALTEDACIYSLHANVSEHYGVPCLKPVVEASASVYVWKPLDLSRLPSLEPRRTDAAPARDPHFFTSGTAPETLIAGMA